MITISMGLTEVQKKASQAKRKATIEAKKIAANTIVFESKLNSEKAKEFEMVYFLDPHGVEIEIKEAIIVQSEPVYKDVDDFQNRLLTLNYIGANSLVSTKKLLSNQVYKSIDELKENLKVVLFPSEND